jgi:hypothetical protein
LKKRFSLERNPLKKLFAWFYKAPTQLRLYGTKTGKIILANLRRYRLKAASGEKTTSPAAAKRCIKTSII